MDRLKIVRARPINRSAMSMTGDEAVMQANVETEQDQVRIRLNGRFDFSAHRTFWDSFAPSLDNKEVREVEIDLGSVDYLDSSALGMLLMLREKAQAANKTVALANCRGSVRQVLDIANFAKLFSIR